MTKIRDQQMTLMHKRKFRNQPHVITRGRSYAQLECPEKKLLKPSMRIDSSVCVQTVQFVRPYGGLDNPEGGRHLSKKSRKGYLLRRYCRGLKCRITWTWATNGDFDRLCQ
jgi:hypothetical protein